MVNSMIGNLPKQEYILVGNVTSEQDLEIAHRFSGDGWEYLQKQFDVYNKLFFRGMLPKVLILCGGRSTRVAGLCFGKAIFVGKDDLFSMNCVLLHEMLHLDNKHRNINDFNHGFSWIESTVKIHKVLNIDIDIYKFSMAEAEGWPHVMFKNYQIESYFKKMS